MKLILTVISLINSMINLKNPINRLIYQLMNTIRALNSWTFNALACWFKRQLRQNTDTKSRNSIAGTSVTCMKNLAGPQTLGSMSLLKCEIYQRGWVSRVADTKLILFVAYLIRPSGLIPGVGWVRRNQTKKIQSINARTAMVSLLIPFLLWRFIISTP